MRYYETVDWCVNAGETFEEGLPEELGVEVEESVSAMVKRESKVLAEEEGCYQGFWIGYNPRIDHPYIYCE